MSTVCIGKRLAGLKGSDESRRRVAVILDYLGSSKRATEAAAELGLGTSRFQALSRQFLQAGLDGIEPRPAGRPREADRVPAGAGAPASTEPSEVERAFLVVALRVLAVMLGHAPPPRVPATTPEALMKAFDAFEAMVAVTLARIHEASPDDPKTGRTRQDDRRAHEHDLRVSAVALAVGLRAAGVSWTAIAEQAGIPAATLRDWQRKQRVGGLRPIRRGRTGAEVDQETRQAICTTLALLGPCVSLKPLLEQFPRVPRRFLASMRRRFRRVFRVRGRIRSWRLSWRRPRAVWSLDGVQPPEPIDSWAKKAIVVRDLGARRTLGLVAVSGENEASVVEILEQYFVEHGPPLVLKLDNGSGFIAEEVKDLCARWRVVLLYSPPRSPWYQGAIERSVRTVRDVIDEIAARQGRPGRWTRADLDVARIALDHEPGLQADELTPAEIWRRAEPISRAERNAFYEKYAARSPGRNVHPREERKLIQNILVASGLLEITPVNIPGRKPKRGLVRYVGGRLAELARQLRRRFDEICTAVCTVLGLRAPTLLALTETAA